MSLTVLTVLNLQFLQLRINSRVAPPQNDMACNTIEPSTSLKSCFVMVVEMAQQRLSLSYKTVSYINYDLCFEWSWQWHMVTSLMTSLWSNNTPSPGALEARVSELACGTVGGAAGSVSARQSK